MTRVFGILIGIGILGLAFVTLMDSLEGWSAGHADIGFWWAVITAFLGLGGLSAIVGTYLHTDGDHPIPVVGSLKESAILFYRGVEHPSATDEQ